MRAAVEAVEAECTEAARVRAAAEAEAAAGARRSGPAVPSDLPSLPPLVDRKTLYRSSYEALIDRILEMQDGWHAWASVVQGVEPGSA